MLCLDHSTSAFGHVADVVKCQQVRTVGIRLFAFKIANNADHAQLKLLVPLIEERNLLAQPACGPLLVVGQGFCGHDHNVGCALNVGTHQHAAAVHRLLRVRELFNDVLHEVLRFHLVCEAHVAANNKSERKHGQNQRGNKFPVKKERGKQRRCRKGNDRGKQPASDDVDNTRHAVHGRLLTPSSVGERGAHTHHKHHKRGAQRQAKARRVGNKRRREEQVHAAAHVVKRGLGADVDHAIGLNLGKSRVGPRAHPATSELRKNLCYGKCRRGYSAAHRIWLEFLTSFALACEVNLGLTDLAGFGIGPKG